MDPVTFNLKDSVERRRFDYYDPTDLDTEVRILKSDLLALQVIQQLNLDKQPEFGGTKQAPSDSLGPDNRRAPAGFRKDLCVARRFQGQSAGLAGSQYQDHRNPLPQPRQEYRGTAS